MLIISILGLINPSIAALNDIGGGLVEDTEQHLYWMKDANIVQTACNATSGPEKALWDAFDPTIIPNNSGRSKAVICAFYRGALNWYETQVWMDILNSQRYLGFDDWRLPKTPQPDASCEQQITDVAPFPNQGLGYNCRGSELGHLFNIGLDNPNHGGTGATGGKIGVNCLFSPIFEPLRCFQNSQPFINALSASYWSKTAYKPDPDFIWMFFTQNGAQSTLHKISVSNFIWPVRDTPPQPVPALSGLSLLLLGFGVSLFGVFYYRQYGCGKVQ